MEENKNLEKLKLLLAEAKKQNKSSSNQIFLTKEQLIRFKNLFKKGEFDNL